MTDIKLLRLAASLDRCQVEYALQKSTRRKGRPAANLDCVDSLQGGSLARRGLAARLGPAAKVNCRVSKLRSGCKRELGRRHP